MNGTKCGIMLLHCKCYLCTKPWCSGMAWGRIFCVVSIPFADKLLLLFIHNVNTGEGYTQFTYTSKFSQAPPVLSYLSEHVLLSEQHRSIPSRDQSACTQDVIARTTRMIGDDLWVPKGLCNVATRMTFLEDSVLGTEFHWDSSLHPNALPMTTQCWTMHESTTQYLLLLPL